MWKGIITLRRVSMCAGAGLVAIGAYVATSHIEDAGLRTLICGIAAGSVVAVPAMSQAHATWAVVLAVVSILAAEAFGVINQAERMLAERSVKSSEAERLNRERSIAVANEKAAREKVEKAEAAEAAERLRGGCAKVCQGLEAATAKAKLELAAAQEALKAAPATVVESHLANATGLPRVLVDLVPSLLASVAINGLAFALLAIGHGGHPPASKAETPAVPELEEDETDRVVDWVRAFERRHGRKPQIPELQAIFSLPKTTAWRRIKAA